ncbi:hypothetical protein R1sor_006062 [Riccia sorocarpa]|uniref:Uncharacterized protein n=1 Tax=Riccia sorocarpa TaxID=122646 RepID=A0ABD3HQK5_9MARC
MEAAKDIKNGCFLVARKFVGIQEAADVATRIHAWAVTIGAFSLPRFLRLIRAGQSPATPGEDMLVLAVRDELKETSVQTQSLSFNPTDWFDADGKAFNSSLRASQVYFSLAASKEMAQVSRFNRKWGVTWGLQQWRQVADTSHIFLFCPRWRSLWQELGPKLDGWDEACS